MTIDLDKKFNPFPNRAPIAFDSFTFSGGEPHIKISSNLSNVKEVMITHRLRSFNDMGLFLLVVDALRRSNVSTINAFLPYFPAARQDRVMVPGEPLSIKVMTDLINNSGIDRVMIYDAHSDVAAALLNNCRSLSNHLFIEQVVNDLPNDLKLISPDGGALKKIHKLASHLHGFEVVECSKTRDIQTGKLSGFKVFHENLNGNDCLVVDDICDGGGTFLGLADVLKKKNAGKLYLAVSHGIFSRGLDELKSKFDMIFCTDSFHTIDPVHGFKQIPLIHSRTFKQEFA